MPTFRLELKGRLSESCFIPQQRKYFTVLCKLFNTTCSQSHPTCTLIIQTVTMKTRALTIVSSYMKKEKFGFHIVSEDLNILWSSKTSGILVTKSNLLINRYKRCSVTGDRDGGKPFIFIFLF